MLLIVAPALYGHRAAITGYEDEATIVGVGAAIADNDGAKVMGVVRWECCMISALVGCHWWMRGRGRHGGRVHCAMGLGGVVFGCVIVLRIGRWRIGRDLGRVI